MRIYSQDLVEAISSPRYQARQCVKITVGVESYYFVSHSDVVTPEPDQTFNATILKLNTISQNNTPEKRISTIGDFSFELSDKNRAVTNWLRDFDLNDQSLVDSQVQLLIGSAGLDFSDYAPVVTQFIKRIASNDRRYTFKASDALRFINKKVFTGLHSTSLLLDLEPDATTVNVGDTAGFPLVAHGSSYTDGSAGQTVGYLYLEGEDDSGNKYSEVIRYTGMTANSFTGCTRGALNTRPRFWSGPSESKSGAVANEHVFLQMPGPKLAWALMTGELYGQPGERLPDHWHSGISSAYIDLYSFENYGHDFWNPSDDTEGVILRFDGVSEENSKSFVEREIGTLIGASLLINALGELTLTRTLGVITNAPTSITLTEKDIEAVTDFDRNLETIQNQFLIAYGFRRDQQEFKRKHGFIDTESVARHGVSNKIKYLAFKGLHSTTHSLDLIRNLVTPMRDRIANDSVRATVTARLSAAVVDVGDAVKIALKNWPDFTSTDGINRSFEVQKIAVDWLLGKVNLDLFGTSRRSAPLPPYTESLSTAINLTGWTLFTSVLTPGTFTDDGDTLTITGDNDLTGFSTASVNGALVRGWFYPGNVVFAGGSLTHCSGHFILDADDVSVFGDISTVGGGQHIVTDEPRIAYDAAFIRGPINCGDTTHARHVWREDEFSTVRISHAYYGAYDPLPAEAMPLLAPSLADDGTVIGIPETLDGMSGVNTEPAWYSESLNSNPSQVTRDTNFGEGGRPGGGVILSCNHLYGEGIGQILVSGENGKEPAEPLVKTFRNPDDLPTIVRLWAGNGAGGYPAGVMILQKTSDAPPDLSILIDAQLGASGFVGSADVISKNSEWSQNDGTYLRRDLLLWYQSQGARTHETPTESTLGFFGPSSIRIPREEMEGGRIFDGFEVGRTFYLTDPGGDISQPGDTPAEPASKPLNLSLTRSPDSSSVLLDATIFTATVTPPANASYQYSLFEIRNPSKSTPWERLRYSTPNEATIRVNSDGETYEIRARSVSVLGVTNDDAITETITAFTVSTDPDTSDGSDPNPPAELRLADITGLSLVNAVGDSGEALTQFKSGAALFSWDKTAASFDGRGVSIDPHFAGYIVEIYRVNVDNSATKVRESLTLDNSYTYTLDENKKDDTGRRLEIRVKAISNGTYETPAVSLRVENPPPAAPANIRTAAGYSALSLIFDLPDDVDFLGVDLFTAPTDLPPGDVYSLATADRRTGNTILIEGLAPGSNHIIGLTSVDAFGPGESIAQYVAQTNNITSSALGNIDTPLLLDETGRIITNNDGFKSFIGTIGAPAESNQPLIIGANDGSQYVFWIDAEGNMKLNLITAAAALAVGAAAFGEAGFQVESNDGNPRLHLGPDDAEKSIYFEDSELIVGDNVALVGVDGYANRKQIYLNYKGWELGAGPVYSSSSVNENQTSSLTSFQKSRGSTEGSVYISSTPIVDGFALNKPWGFKVVAWPNIRTYGSTAISFGVGDVELDENSLTVSDTDAAWFRFTLVSQFVVAVEAYKKRGSLISKVGSTWNIAPNSSGEMIYEIHYDGAATHYTITDQNGVTILIASTSDPYLTPVDNPGALATNPFHMKMFDNENSGSLSSMYFYDFKLRGERP